MQKLATIFWMFKSIMIFFVHAKNFKQQKKRCTNKIISKWVAVFKPILNNNLVDLTIHFFVHLVFHFLRIPETVILMFSKVIVIHIFIPWRIVAILMVPEEKDHSSQITSGYLVITTCSLLGPQILMLVWSCCKWELLDSGLRSVLWLDLWDQRVF